MSKTVMVVIRKPQLIALSKILDRTFSHFCRALAALFAFFAAPHRTFCHSGEVRYRTFWHFLPHLNIAPYFKHLVDLILLSQKF